MKVTKHNPVPVVQPPVTFTLELSREEAFVILRALGGSAPNAIANKLMAINGMDKEQADKLGATVTDLFYDIESVMDGE